jgi:hypothetical protein
VQFVVSQYHIFWDKKQFIIASAIVQKIQSFVRIADGIENIRANQNFVDGVISVFIRFCHVSGQKLMKLSCLPNSGYL